MGASATPAHHKKKPGLPTRSVPHLFDRWDEISGRVQAAKEIRLFLDFDGTLAHHCPHPDSVKLDNQMKKALGKIASHRQVHVGIVSGRRRATLQRLIQIPRIEFYGLYGWENGNDFDVSIPTTLHLREMAGEIEEHSVEMRGIEVEDKGASVAVHFRDAPAAARRRADQLIRNAVSNSKGDLHIVETESAWDVVPSRVQGKGTAIRNVLEDVRHAYLPIYVGDDISDEPALEELRRGITVRVGPARRTEARYRLRDSDEVCEFLNRMEKELP